jgi:hypothetical protein
MGEKSLFRHQTDPTIHDAETARRRRRERDLIRPEEKKEGTV